MKIANLTYRCNGKEFEDRIEGFHFYDYGARFYDAALARWHSVDPLAEKGRQWSPYTYVFNNPMNFTDPDGRWASLTAKDRYRHDFELIGGEDAQRKRAIHYDYIAGGPNKSTGTESKTKEESKDTETETTETDEEVKTATTDAFTLGAFLSAALSEEFAAIGATLATPLALVATFLIIPGDTPISNEGDNPVFGNAETWSTGTGEVFNPINNHDPNNNYDPYNNGNNNKWAKTLLYGVGAYEILNNCKESNKISIPKKEESKY